MAETLLRPNQIAEYETTREALVRKLESKYIQDKGAVRKQIRRLDHNLETQRPKELQGPEKDKVVRENKALLEDILIGMPSHEEMRKAPPGAIDKHRSWEARNKEKILKWKNNQLRLNAGTNQVDIANLEVHRPQRSTLSMDNAFIPGTDYHLPDKIGYSVPLSDEDIRLIRKRAPADIWRKLPTLSAEQRMVVRQMYITTWDEPEEETVEETEEEELPLAAELEGPQQPGSEVPLLSENSIDEEALSAAPEMEATDSISDISALWNEEGALKKPASGKRRNRK